MDCDNIVDSFQAFDHVLAQYTALWRASPFVENLRWQAQYPDLYQAALTLTDKQLASFDENETNLQTWLARYLPALSPIYLKLNQIQLAMKTTVSELNQHSFAKFSDIGLPGRKKQQIVGFISHLKANVPTEQVVNITDWCSGKGHLAKQLHYALKANIDCWEFDEMLCQAGKQQADKAALPLAFYQQDVLMPFTVAQLSKLGGSQLHTALHACGDLHCQTLKTATQLATSHIAIAPCCYHLIQSEDYQALSDAAKHSALILSKSDLRLAVLQTATAGQRVKRLRKTELIWRLAFDLLLQALTGVAVYQSQASFNKKCLTGNFVDFCQMMLAKQSQLHKHVAIDFIQSRAQNYLLQAEEQYQQIIRLEKVRLGFRAILEQWLIFDRVLFLQQQGYRVTLKQFCITSVSPRNTLILASKVKY